MSTGTKRERTERGKANSGGRRKAKSGDERMGVLAAFPLVMVEGYLPGVNVRRATELRSTCMVVAPDLPSLVLRISWYNFPNLVPLLAVYVYCIVTMTRLSTEIASLVVVWLRAFQWRQPPWPGLYWIESWPLTAVIQGFSLAWLSCRIWIAAESPQQLLADQVTCQINWLAVWGLTDLDASNFWLDYYEVWTRLGYYMYTQSCSVHADESQQNVCGN